MAYRKSTFGLSFLGLFSRLPEGPNANGSFPSQKSHRLCSLEVNAPTWSVFLPGKKCFFVCVFLWLSLYQFGNWMKLGTPPTKKTHFKNPLLARPSGLQFSPSMAPKQTLCFFLHWPARTAGGWLKGFSRKTPTTPILQERIFLGVDAPCWSHLFIIQWCSVRLEARSPVVLGAEDFDLVGMVFKFSRFLNKIKSKFLLGVRQCFYMVLRFYSGVG